MNKRDCNTLEEVYQDPPPSIPWDDIRSLFRAIANEYGGSCRHSPGSVLILNVPQQRKVNDMSPVIIRVPYIPMLCSTVIDMIELNLDFAGIPLCP